MKPRLLSLLIAGLSIPCLAQAQEQAQKEWSGSVSFGVRNAGISANDPSKLNEYRDLESGANPFGGFELRRRGDKDYLDAYGENIGRDDQYLDLRGGRYGSYKYRLYHDQLRRNFGSGPGARTPYGTVGTGTLLGTLPNTNPGTWATFDHSYRRQDVGGFFELQKVSPWYFRVDANEVKRDGMDVFAGAKGINPGFGFMDLPAPVAYTTKNVSAEVGYSGRQAHFALSYTHSEFDNGHKLLRWQNDNFGNGLDTTLLAPDNTMHRLGVNGSLRGLPLGSTLAARYTYSALESDVTMLQTMLSTGGANPATNPSEPVFHGEHKRHTLGLSLASRPARSLDTRLYYNYDKLQNDSTPMTFDPPVNSGLRAVATDPRGNCANVAGSLCEPELFHYRKHNIGAEAGYALARGHKLRGGIDWVDSERERGDFQDSKETRLFGELKSALSDSLTGRIKYQYMKRSSHFHPHEAVVAANPLDLYVRRFDLANARQHQVKLGLDQSFANQVDVGLEMILKRTEYPDTPLGRTKDQRQEFYASVGWGDPGALRLSAFGDLEYTQYDSNHRVGTGDPDPATPPNAGTYNWSAKNKDTSWQVGIGADWVPRSRLKVKTSLLYAQTDGRADFSVQPGGAPGPFLPITNFDNTRRTALNLRAVYEYSRAIELSGGYAYERYHYSDIGYDNTKYVAATLPAPSTLSYTTGQNAFQPYSANILFAAAKYKF